MSCQFKESLDACVFQPIPGPGLAKIGWALASARLPTEVVHNPAVGKVGRDMVVPSPMDKGPRMDLIRFQSTAQFSCLVLGSVCPGGPTRGG